MDDTTKHIIIIGAILVLALFLLNSMSGDDQTSLLEFLLSATLVVLFVVLGVQYSKGVDITASVKGWFNNPELDITVSSEATGESTGGGSQTFHVPGQFDYDGAKQLCSAFGGKLASIQNVTDAYTKGAEWCDYGWSDNGMALYPTQYATWEKLKQAGHEQVCGRPGVNGGYINNMQQKLGVNCYGTKPPQPENYQPTEIVPAASSTTVDMTATNPVSAFNYTRWNE